MDRNTITVAEFFNASGIKLTRLDLVSNVRIGFNVDELPFPPQQMTGNISKIIVLLPPLILA